MQDLKKLEEEQRILSESVSLNDGFMKIRRIAGADSSFSRGRAFSSVVVCDAESLDVIEAVHSISTERFPYIPGFLSYRELRPIKMAFDKLSDKPDMLLLDAYGICHPRRFGLASHAGIVLDLPTIGVAKSRLCGREEGERIILNGRQSGWVIRRNGSGPIFVSPGHMVSLESAKSIVLLLLRKHRLPEPLRLAHLYSKRERRCYEENKYGRACKESEP